jgi:peptide/nickel transport system substrate-binding protein
MRRLRWAIGIGAVAMVAAGCGAGTGTEESPEGGGSVVYDEQIPPKANWAPETDDAHALVRAGCLETLVKYGYDGDAEPMLATKWTQVDKTNWQFTLRDGVKFQNGDPMDADAVVGAIDHVLKAQTPARALNPKVISAVKAVDKSTVQVTTPAPDPVLPLRFASPNSGILAPEAYSGDQVNIKGTCTGPFTVTKEVPAQSLSLKANKSYWGGKPKIASAEVRFVIDGATRTTQIQTGEAQIVRGIPAASLATVKGDDQVKTETVALPRTTVMLLNNSRPPFDNPLVRQAIQQAVDTKAIIDGVYEGTGQQAVGPFSPDTPWAAADAQAVGGDMAQAQSLLQQAGVDPKSLSITLLAYTDRPEFADLATVIQDQLKQLGIKVKIKAGEYAGMEPDLLSGNFDAALFSRGYLVDVADPGSYFVSDWTCDGSYNIAHYCDKQTDQMVSDAVATEDQDSRNQKFAEIGARLQSQAASDFLVHEEATWGLRSNVSGFKPHPLDYYVLTADLSVS